jgi:hypothetical protein
MTDRQLRALAAAGLVIGALLGTAGSFAPTAELRGLAWGLDGVALVVASALLVVHHVRNGNDQLAAGFLIFLAGQTPVVSGSALHVDRLGLGARQGRAGARRRHVTSDDYRMCATPPGLPSAP